MPNPLLALQRSGYPMMAGRDGDAPPTQAPPTQAPPTQAPPSQATPTPPSTSSPAGQMIEKVPNPHLPPRPQQQGHRGEEAGALDYRQTPPSSLSPHPQHPGQGTA